MKTLNRVLTIFFFFLTFLNLSFAQRWEKIQNIPSPYANNYWLDVFFHPSNSNYGWVCGFNGMVAYTTDGGNSWRGSTIANAYHLESIHFPSLRVGYCSGVDGIFKSTDGGATWFDITPVGARDTTFFWGCYFLNERYGVLVGDGCGADRRQHFWLTTDGGNSWSVFLGNEDNSGLTDAMLYPNGSGFASSSGKIWITSDSGRTWQVFSNVGPNLWQEEITNFNSSFLVPYSGVSCTGGGNDGGMRFSTNNGTTWSSYRTGVPMFGTFLLGNQTGWACGYSREVYYTSNGGQTWAKFNCGIENSHLDDLWFIDENRGWVVGQGIYRLAKPMSKISKRVVDFGRVCLGQKKFDTIWVGNINFNDTHIRLNLSGSSDFQIVTPGTSAYIQSCDSIFIVVSFAPQSSGSKTGNLNITFSFQDQVSINLFGEGVSSSSRLKDSIIVLDNCKAGLTYQLNSEILVDNNGEVISRVTLERGGLGFRLVTPLPKTLYASGGNFLTFEVTPRDTGWFEAVYRMRFEPCEHDKLLRIRVYSRSPIISTDSAINLDFYCKTGKIKIPFRNFGNDTLFFRKLSFSSQQNRINLIGWSSGRSLLGNFILPFQTDTLIIEIDSNFTGQINTILFVENNDLTSARGQKNVIQIRINIRQFRSNVSFEPIFIDFGKICLGDTICKNVLIKNIGNLSEVVTKVFSKGFVSIKKVFPFSIMENDSLRIDLCFAPKKTGKFVDTLIFSTLNCNDTFKVVCIGEAIVQTVVVNPNFLNLRFFQGQTTDKIINLLNLNDDSLEIIKIELDSGIQDVVSRVAYDKKYVIFGDSTIVSIQFQGKFKGKFKGSITISLSGTCDTLIRIPIFIEIVDKDIVVEPLVIDFGKIFCTPTKKARTVVLSNRTEFQDTIKNVKLIQSSNNFLLKGLPNFPFIINSYDSLIIDVSYFPNQIGEDTALVVFEFEDTTRNVICKVFGFYGFSRLKTEVNRYSFGEFEYCVNPNNFQNKIFNLGNYSDSIFLRKPFSNTFFKLHLTRFSIGPNDSVEFYISFTPPLYEGIYIDTLIVGFRNCLQFDTIVVSGIVVAPDFVVNPSIINLGTLWKNESKSGQVTIINKWTKDFRVILFRQNVSVNIAFNANFDEDVKVGQSKTFDFLVQAKQTGEFSDTICFKILTECEYSRCIVIQYSIPKEEYNLTFKIGRYFAKPNDEIEVKLENITPSPRLNLDSFVISVEFDKWLFSPYECRLDGKKISFKKDFGKIHFELAGTEIEKFIQNGKFISIFGKVLYSYPDSTILNITEPNWYPPKEINCNLINGLLKVFPICPPLGSLKLEFLPTFKIVSLLYKETGVEIVLNSNSNQTILIEQYDLLGNFVERFEYQAYEGDNYIYPERIFNKKRSEVLLIFSNMYSRRIVFIPLF
ncbi:MAG: choice-of-anchor D domain-containing protein [Ignavibacteria bacterium]|nr:choice-of-anchor D domain-containing protein [Ignavibacteria bacterium]